VVQDTRSTPDEVLEEVMMRQDLSSILSDLSEREAQIMRLRFGIDGEQETTLEDIGAMVGLTRERIRQIEAKALRKLRLKQKEAASVLKDYTEVEERVELAERSSSGTKKSR
jgi:RNA polymerase primary sigma factor